MHFTLPYGYLDDEVNLQRKVFMRLATAMDEIAPVRDPRVKSNPAYATIIILSRVITRLGALDEISPYIAERLFACDLSYLQKFYLSVNELQPLGSAQPSPANDHSTEAQSVEAVLMEA